MSPVLPDMHELGLARAHAHTETNITQPVCLRIAASFLDNILQPELF